MHEMDDVDHEYICVLLISTCLCMDISNFPMLTMGGLVVIIMTYKMCNFQLHFVESEVTLNYIHWNKNHQKIIPLK